MARELKSFKDLDFSRMRVTVVNEIPGSEREISVDQISTEVRRMGAHKVVDLMEGKA